MSDLTTLLESARQGDEAAVGRLFEVLYDDLHQIAHAKLRQSEGLTLLDTTGLVHESYLRLVNLERLQVADRPHFLAYAARSMRSVMVDFARRTKASRRGGELLQVTLDTASANSVVADDSEVIRVHEALEDLARIDDRLARVVELRYFAGLAEQEIAQVLDVSVRTVERDWEKARIFLFARLSS